MNSNDKTKYSIKLNNLDNNDKKSLGLLLHTRIQEIEDLHDTKIEILDVYEFFECILLRYDLNRFDFLRNWLNVFIEGRSHFEGKIDAHAPLVYQWIRLARDMCLGSTVVAILALRSRSSEAGGTTLAGPPC